MLNQEILGALLLRLDLVESEQLQHALNIQKGSRLRLGAILVEQGALTETELGWALARQLDIPYIPKIDTSPEAVDVLAVARLPGEMAFRLNAFPLLLDSNGLTVVMDDPHNALGIRSLSRTTKVPIRVAMGAEEEIARALDSVYHESQRKRVPRVSRSIDGWGVGPELRSELLADESGESLLQWIVGWAREAGDRQLRFYPSETGGIVVGAGGRSDPLKLSGEWYAQMMECLRCSDTLRPVHFVHTDCGEAAKVHLRKSPGAGVRGPVVELVGVKPGVVLICHGDVELREAAVGDIAGSLVRDKKQIVAMGGAPAPKGSQRVNIVSSEALESLRRFEPPVVVWESGSELQLGQWIQKGRSDSWILVSVAADNLVQAVANLRDRRMMSGTLASCLTAVIELDSEGLSGSLGAQVFTPDHLFQAALTNWDLLELRRWRSLRLIAISSRRRLSQVG